MRSCAGATGPVRDAVLLNAGIALALTGAGRRRRATAAFADAVGRGTTGRRGRSTPARRPRSSTAGSPRPQLRPCAVAAVERSDAGAAGRRAGGRRQASSRPRRTPPRGRAWSRCGTRCGSRCRRTPVDLLSRPAMTSASSSWAPDAHHRDQVDVTGDRVDLADPGELGDASATSGIRSTSQRDEHDRGDHGATLAARRHGRSRRDAGRGRASSGGRPDGRRSRRVVGEAGSSCPRAPAPCAGQVQVPSRWTSRTPGASSQRSRHSVSSAWPPAADRRRAIDGLGGRGERRRRRARVGARRACAPCRPAGRADARRSPSRRRRRAGRRRARGRGERPRAAAPGRRRGRRRAAGRGRRRPPRTAPRPASRRIRVAQRPRRPVGRRRRAAPRGRRDDDGVVLDALRARRTARRSGPSRRATHGGLAARGRQPRRCTGAAANASWSGRDRRLGRRRRAERPEVGRLPSS